MSTRRYRTKTIGVAALLLGTALLAIHIIRRDRLPEAILLPYAALDVTNTQPVEQILPENWGSIRKTIAKLRGRRRKRQLNFEAFRTDNALASIIAQNSLGPPNATSNGIGIWVVSTRPFSAPKRDRTGTVILAEDHTRDQGMLVFVPTNEADMAFQMSNFPSNFPPVVSLDTFPRFDGNRIDLSACYGVFWHGRVHGDRPDFGVAFRAQLPYGKMIICLEIANPESTNGRGVVLLSQEVESASTGNGPNVTSGKR